MAYKLSEVLEMRERSPEVEAMDYAEAIEVLASKKEEYDQQVAKEQAALREEANKKAAIERKLKERELEATWKVTQAQDAYASAATELQRIQARSAQEEAEAELHAIGEDRRQYVKAGRL